MLFEQTRAGPHNIARRPVAAGLNLRLGYRIEPDGPHAAGMSFDLWAEPGVAGDGSDSVGADWNGGGRKPLHGRRFKPADEAPFGGKGLGPG